MTEGEWKLRKELAETKRALYEAQSMLIQRLHADAVAESEKLGAAWQEPKENIVSIN